MTLAVILAELTARKGRQVLSTDYATLLALLQDWRGEEGWGS